MKEAEDLNGYQFPGADFAAYIRTHNHQVAARHGAWLAALPKTLALENLRGQVAGRGDAQLARLAGQYLPPAFSRRHGPWNGFQIHIEDAGNPLYAFQGNWRDIFQHWEVLAQSYPGWLGHFIAVFLNASTADGDHQIVYLLRLLESLERFDPGRLASLLTTAAFAYAREPYEIAGFEQLAADPRHAISFNQDLLARLTARAAEVGADGRLLADERGEVLLVSLAEKLLVPLLVNLGNFVPEGGIWMNTQRPEWNDANDAFSGWGLSMVTVCYLRRHVAFLERLLAGCAQKHVALSARVAEFLQQLTPALREARVQVVVAQASSLQTGRQDACATAGFDDASRWRTLAALGRVGSNYRQALYKDGLGNKTQVPLSALRDLLAAAQPVLDASIRANLRPDGLYHSYNVLHLVENPSPLTPPPAGGRGRGEENHASVQQLDPMLEGQVAVLSSGVLSPAEALGVLRVLPSDAAGRVPLIEKLLLAVQECHRQAVRNRAAAEEIEALAAAYDDIRRGLGFGKMAEENLTRWGELGVEVQAGTLRFAPRLLHRSEFSAAPHCFEYSDVQGEALTWELPAESLAFTYCQLPICYQLRDEAGVEIERADGARASQLSHNLNRADSAAILGRDGTIRRVTVFLSSEVLRA